MTQPTAVEITTRVKVGSLHTARACCAQHRTKTTLTAEDPKEHRDGGISGPRNWRVVMQLAASMLQAQEFERHALKISDMLSQCGHIGHILYERGAPAQKLQLDRDHGSRLMSDAKVK